MLLIVRNSLNFPSGPFLSLKVIRLYLHSYHPATASQRLTILIPLHSPLLNRSISKGSHHHMTPLRHNIFFNCTLRNSLQIFLARAWYHPYDWETQYLSVRIISLRASMCFSKVSYQFSIFPSSLQNLSLGDTSYHHQFFICHTLTPHYCVLSASWSFISLVTFGNFHMSTVMVFWMTLYFPLREVMFCSPATYFFYFS